MTEETQRDWKAKTAAVPALDGNTFRDMFSFAVDWFAKSESDINALNVFPIPDGDTGSNMLLTMRSSIEEASSYKGSAICSVADGLAHGALMGARGNSGVILSQIWRGMAQSLQGKESITSCGLAEAFQSASSAAYKALDKPVEGTILTVMKEVATAVRGHLNGNNQDIIAFFETSVAAAEKAVAETPSLLPVLKEAGVVDSGGQGLYVLLQGSLMYLKGETGELQFSKSKIIHSSDAPNSLPDLTAIREEDSVFGYCTEFLLKGESLVPENIRKRLKNKGQSLIVSGDESTLKIHIHCLDPSPVIHYALSLGTISAVSIRNMDEQYDDMRRKQTEPKAPNLPVAVVTVAKGEGLINTFSQIGASAVIPGGATMNPSTKQILQAVETVPSNKVIILPNDKNLVLVAQQIGSLTDKQVFVVPTVTIPQGIAALLAYNPQADIQTNIALMTDSKSIVNTIEVARATRSTKLNGFAIHEGQVIGLLNGKLVAANDSESEVIANILNQIDLSGAENSSIYYGADTEKDEAEKIRQLMFQKNQNLNVEVIHGGQPLYNYIISIE